MPLITGVVNERSGATLMARVLGSARTPITQDTIDTVAYIVTDVTLANDPDPDVAATATIASGSLDPADVIYDQLQTDARWTKDGIGSPGLDAGRYGYNVLWTIPASDLLNGGDRYQADLRFVPFDGQPFVVSWAFTLQNNYFTT